MSARMASTVLRTCKVLSAFIAADWPLFKYRIMLNGSPRCLFLSGRGKRRWKRRRIFVAARAVLADGAGSEAKVVAVDVVLAAGVFVNLVVRLSCDPGSGVSERARIELGIFD